MGASEGSMPRAALKVGCDAASTHIKWIGWSLRTYTALLLCQHTCTIQSVSFANCQVFALLLCPHTCAIQSVSFAICQVFLSGSAGPCARSLRCCCVDTHAPFNPIVLLIAKSSSWIGWSLRTYIAVLLCRHTCSGSAGCYMRTAVLLGAAEDTTLRFLGLRSRAGDTRMTKMGRLVPPYPVQTGAC